MCCLYFNNWLNWAPQISGAFLCILPPLLYSAPQIPAASTPPKSDLPQTHWYSPSSARVPPLCVAIGNTYWILILENTYQYKARVIVLTSSVFPFIGITILYCLVLQEHNCFIFFVLFPICLQWKVKFSIGYSVLAEADMYVQPILFVSSHPVFSLHQTTTSLPLAKQLLLF